MVKACALLTAAAVLAIVPLPGSGPTAQTTAAGSAQPNVLVVLVDDMSLELVQHLPALGDLAAHGVTFTNFIVSTPLCCPSRASLLSGQHPHVTGVVTNGREGGGFAKYRQERDRDLGFALQRAGYRTAMIGKYLNGYDPFGRDGAHGYERGYVPRGWNEWTVGSAYAGWHYTVTDSVDGFPPPGENLDTYDGETEADYFTDFASRRAVEFLERAPSNQPFALFVMPFAVHKNVGQVEDPDSGHPPKFPPAPRDRPDSATAPTDWRNEFPSGDCGGGVEQQGGCRAVAVPDPMWKDSFNEVGAHAPSWRAGLPPLTEAKLHRANVLSRQRAQSLQAVSDLVVALKDAIGARLSNTYIVFASDNGFFLGQHRLFDGKGTAYDHDSRVPLVIVPPGGLTEARVVPAITQNVDIAPTLIELAGARARLAPDGRSLTPFLGAAEPDVDWRAGALISYHGGTGLAADRSPATSTVPAYKALRTEAYLYVDYSDVDNVPPSDHHVAEFYWLESDPEQLDNRFDELTVDDRDRLNAALLAYATCIGPTCREADSSLPDITLPGLGLTARHSGRAGR